MPSNWSIVDATFPTFKGDETPRQQINALLDYMKVLTEQLQYSLDNLDVNNWNAVALKNFSNDVVAGLAKDVLKLVSKVTNLEQTLSKLGTEVDSLSKLAADVKQLGTDITAQRQNLSDLQQTVTGINETISQMDGKITKLREDVDALLGGTGT